MSLSEEQRRTLQTFKDFTQINDDQEGARILRRHNWDVDAAVQAYLQEQDDGVLAAAESNNSTNDNDGGVNPRERLPQNPAAKRFLTSYEKKYGKKHPKFLLTSYKEAVDLATREFKFLLVYLHCDLHEDTPAFCKTILSNDRLIQFLDESVYVWGGSVELPDAYGTAEALGCAGYPNLVLLSCVARGVTIIEKFMGLVTVETLVQRLTAATERFREHHEAARRQRQEMEEARRLRQEQDRAYEEALEADRQREAAEREKREKEENARIEEEKRKQREESERLKKEQERRSVFESKQLKLGEEPKRGTQGTTYIRFIFPNGSRVERCFHHEDTLELVRDYIDVELYKKDLPIVNYELSTNFPRRTFTEQENGLKLKEANLVSQEVLYVQDLDS